MAEVAVRTASIYTIVSIGIPMEVAARFKRATFKLSCKTQAKRKKYRLTPIAFPHGNEPFNCKQNRFPHPPVPRSHRIVKGGSYYCYYHVYHY